MVIRVVFLCLAYNATDTAHDRLLIDVCVMTHEERVPSVIEQLAVYEVVTGSANHEKTVAEESYTSGFVAQSPVRDTMNYKRSKEMLVTELIGITIVASLHQKTFGHQKHSIVIM